MENYINTEKKLLYNNNSNQGGAILAVDPSGHTQSGYFLVRSWSDWEVGTFEDEKWQNHAKFFHNYAKKEKVGQWAIETTGNYLKTWSKGAGQGSFMAVSYFDLLKCLGALFYIAEIEEIEVKGVLNLSVDQAERKARRGEIVGLKFDKINVKTEHFNKKGIMKSMWFFKNRYINEHEKDAVLIFYVYWVTVKKNKWPWTEWD